MISFKKMFAAPSFDDEVKTQQAYMLNIILWTLVCVPIPYVIYALVLTPGNSSRTLIQVIFGETVNIILLLMLHRGYVKAASIIQVSAFWFFFTVTAFTGNGVQGEAYLLGYGLVIAVAGILLGGAGASVFTVLSLTAGGWMVYGQIQDFANFSFDNSPLTTWFVSLVLFPVGAVLQHLASRNVQNALDQAHASEEKYRQISTVSSDYTFSTELDSKGNMLLNWVAGAFESMTGYTHEEYVAQGGWLANLHPDDIEKDAQALATLKTNQPITHDIRTYTKSKDVQWVRVYAHPVWDGKENRLAGIVGAVQDITERKQAEEALRESEAIYRQAIEVAGAVPYHQTYLENGNVIYDFIGEGIRQITGYGPEEFNEKLWDSLVQERLLLEELAGYSLIDAIERVRSGINPVWKCEHYIMDRDGKIHWVFEAAVDLRDEYGIAHGSVGLYQDITERKQSEEALKYERDLLQIFMDNIPDTVYFKDRESQFVRINQAQARLLGLDNPQDAIGKTDLDFQSPELARRFMAEEKQILETGQSILNRIEFNPEVDGKPRWLSATKVPVKDRAGHTVGIIGISRDVTEQKIAEELEQSRRTMLEKVVKLGQNVTEVHDLRTTLARIWHGVHDDLGFDRLAIHLYNPERKSMDGTFGTNNQGEMIDEWHTWFSMEQDNPDSKSFLHIFEKPDSISLTHTFENDYNIPKGHNMSGVKDHAAIGAWTGDKPIAVISVDNRITDRPFTEEQLEALQLFAGYVGLAIENTRLNSALENELAQRKNFIVELEAKNAELERFTYTVSHDLKSPLVTIRGFLGYLERDAQEGNYEKLKHDTQRIESAVEKMQNLLKDLLELSRVGRLMNTPVEIPFHEIVKDALEILDGQIKAGKVLVDYKTSDILVKCDRVRMTEVLQNLIDNAIKFMGSQPNPHIEIGAFLNDNHENVFYVKDNGIGIAPEFHGKIFGLFDKLTSDSEGTGIGLALVKRIIEVHGGHIWVESQIGQGTAFYFTLP